MENKMTPIEALKHLQLLANVNDNYTGDDDCAEIIEQALTEHKKLKEIIIGMYEATCNMINYLRERLKNPNNLVDENNLLRMRGERDAYKKIIDLFEDKKSVENYIEQGFEIAQLKHDLVNYEKQKQILDFLKSHLDIKFEVDEICGAKNICINGKWVNHETMYDLIKEWLSQ